MLAKRLAYTERAALCQHTLAKAIFQLLHDKKTNLALSADVIHCDELLALADQLGQEIAVLKTHVDILTDFTPAFTSELRRLAKKHQFFIFEDRKFADIGNTVKHQYQDGIYHISDWADIINAHTVPGPGIVSGLQEVGLPKNRGLLLLAEMSSANHLFTKDYIQQTVKIAEQFPEFVLGFIAQHKLDNNPCWIYMTPGIKLTEGTDALGQQYVTPEKALIEHQTDIIIVGRGIIKADDPLAVAKEYRARGFAAYERSLGSA